MDAAAGTRGSVDAVIRGLGLDPAVAPPTAALPVAPAGTARAGEAVGGRTAGEAGVTPPAPAAGAGGNRLVLRVVGVATACVVGAVVLGLVIATWTGTPLPGPATVPNLVGMPLTRADVAASDAGFELIAPIYVRRDDVPEGTVVSQDPQAGTVMDTGSEIQPIVGTGPSAGVRARRRGPPGGRCDRRAHERGPAGSPPGVRVRPGPPDRGGRLDGAGRRHVRRQRDRGGLRRLRWPGALLGACRLALGRSFGDTGADPTTGDPPALDGHARADARGHVDAGVRRPVAVGATRIDGPRPAAERRPRVAGPVTERPERPPTGSRSLRDAGIALS